jgi:8-oxo-dGTP pyrophosphatase MutT (NUDIX family)
MIEEAEDGLRIKGRKISSGKIVGSVLKSTMPLSLGNISIETSEILDEQNEIQGEQIRDRVLVIPCIKEIEKYDNPIRKLKEKNLHPKAIVAESLDMKMISDADEIVVNATNGFVALKNVTLKNIATSVIISEDLILILKRSDNVGTYKGMWACVSGYVEKGETPDEAAIREISEELSLKREDYEFIRKGEVLHARDKETMWRIHPFLFEVKSGSIKLDWEHLEFKWIHQEEIVDYNTVPKLKKTIENVLIKEARKST